MNSNLELETKTPTTYIDVAGTFLNGSNISNNIVEQENGSTIRETEVEEDEEELVLSDRTFDPREIDISVEQKSIDFLLSKLEYKLDD